MVNIIHCVKCGQPLREYPKSIDFYYCEPCRAMYDFSLTNTFSIRGLSLDEIDIIHNINTNTSKIIAFLHRVAVFTLPEEDWQKIWNQMVIELEQTGKTYVREKI